MVLLLSGNDVRSLVRMKDAITIVEEAFNQQAQGRVEMPLRPFVFLKENEGSLTVMPAYVGGSINALGTKLVTAFLKNYPKYGLPTVIGTIVLNDPKTGSLLAIIEGTYLTAIRTGATSGVATKYLARKDASTVGIFGAGVQSRAQLTAMCEVRDIERAKVFDIDPTAKAKYCIEMTEKLEIEVLPVGSPREVANGSDIIITATASKVPVFEGHWVNKGVHINAIGSHASDAREIDDITIQGARIVVDWKRAVLEEEGGVGDIVIPLSRGLILERDIDELNEVVSNKKPGRQAEDENTLFKSVGVAIEDVSTAAKVYELAVKKGIGRTLEL